MTFREYLGALRRRARIITVCAVIGLNLGAVPSLFSPDRYQATSRVFISNPQVGSAAENLDAASVFTQRRITSYQRMVSNSAVLLPVIRAKGLGETVQELAEQVSVTSPTDSVVMNIRVTRSTPEEAGDLANGIAAGFAAFVGEVETSSGQRTSPVTVSTVPASPQAARVVQVRTMVNVSLGLVTGVLVGLLLAATGEQRAARHERRAAAASLVPTG
jgi:capsular polysaccharide biosynthesis protein